MPAIQNGKILVSGANGYLAVWIVKKLLEQGYSVRGTVRSERSVPYLKNLFGSYGDKFELVLVPDITKDGAFDTAVQGIDAIAHTASPFHSNASHPSEMIDPAVLGTTSILQSARRYGDAVKRVIILSSVAAIAEAGGYTPENPVTLTEDNWNEKSAVACEEQGKDVHPAHMYFASKTLGEKAAWDFAAKHKHELKFDVVSLNPPYVHGPFLHDVSASENLNTSLAYVYQNVIKGPEDPKTLTTVGASWVDVRDITDAHVRAFQKEEAGGQRIIVAAGRFVWQQWVNAAHHIDNSLSAGAVDFDVSQGLPPVSFDTTKSRELLGIQYIDMEQCTKDMVAQFKEKGWY